MEEIAERAHQLQARHADAFHNQVLPALEEQNIRIVGWNDLIRTLSSVCARSLCAISSRF